MTNETNRPIEPLTIDGWLVTHSDGTLPTVTWGCSMDSDSVLSIEVFRGPDDSIGRAYTGLHNIGSEDKMMRKARVTIELLPDGLGGSLSVPQMETEEGSEDAQPTWDDPNLTSEQIEELHRKTCLYALKWPDGDWVCATDDGGRDQPVTFRNADDAADYVAQYHADDCVTIALMNLREAARVMMTV